MSPATSAYRLAAEGTHLPPMVVVGYVVAGMLIPLGVLQLILLPLYQRT